MSEHNTGKLIPQSCSLDKVAGTLEINLGVPVLNETGMKGVFSAITDLPGLSSDAARSALELTLVRGRRKVERITFEY